MVLALGISVLPVEAQRGRHVGGGGLRGGDGPNLGHSVELALEHREDLGLTGDQIVRLQELQAMANGDVAALTEEMRALREKIRGGEVEREEGFRQMEALRGEFITASAPLRGRVQEILTVQQHNKLRPLVREARPGRGRGQGMGAALQPRGMRGGMGAVRPGQLRGGRSGRPGARLHLRPGGQGRMGPAWRGNGGGGIQPGPGGEDSLS